MCENRKPVVLIGSGGHAKVLRSLLKDRPSIMLHEGEQRILQKWKGCPFLVAFGDVGTGAARLRKEAYEKVNAAGLIPLSLHSFNIGQGSVVMGHVGPEATVGVNCIINTNSIVEHDCSIGSHTHVASGAILCGGVTVGECAFIGAGAVIKQGVKVGNDAIVGCGSVVVHDVPDGWKVAGNPARLMKSKVLA